MRGDHYITRLPVLHELSCRDCPFAAERRGVVDSGYHALSAAGRRHHEKTGHIIIVRSTTVTIYGEPTTVAPVVVEHLRRSS